MADKKNKKMTITDEIKTALMPFILKSDNYTPSDVLRLMVVSAVLENKSVNQYHIDQLNRFLRTLTVLEAKNTLHQWSEIALHRIQNRFDITTMFEEQQHVFGTQITIIAINLNPK